MAAGRGDAARGRLSGAVPEQPAFRRRILKHDLAAYIRDLVFSAELRPGARVDQDAIARVFGISKLPVREALIVLESEGLIVSYPNRGSFVAELQPDDFYDSFLIVGELSALAARRAAVRITDEELGRLRECLDCMANTSDVDAAEVAHHEFHRIINLAGGSQRLNRMLRRLSNAIPERKHYESRIPDMEMFEEDRTLFEALEAKASERAAEAILSHFTHGAQHAVALLRKGGFWENRG